MADKYVAELSWVVVVARNDTNSHNETHRSSWRRVY